MCKRDISRLIIFIIVIPFVGLTFFNCKKETDTNQKFNEIFKLSKIEIPSNSKLLKYYDNEEFQIVFELEISNKELIKFIKKYRFKKIQSNIIKISKTSSDSYIVQDIENGFITPTKILINDKTLIYNNSHAELILSCNKYILYGLISY